MTIGKNNTRVKFNAILGRINFIDRSAYIDITKNKGPVKYTPFGSTFLGFRPQLHKSATLYSVWNF